MNKQILLLFYLITNTCLAQTSSFNIKKHPSRIRLSAEEIQTDFRLNNGSSEPNMGFIGHGYEVFGLYSKIPKAYFGVTSYSAITGIRSGFFVFGVSGGYQNQLLIPKLNYDLGFFIGGGGGSGAPDGGGLMIRPHLDFSYQITPKLSIRSGLSYIDFPTGEINSFNFNFGLSINTHTFIADEIDYNTTGTQASIFNKIEISLLYSTLFNFTKGPLKNNGLAEGLAVKQIALIGSVLKTKQKNN